MIWLINEYKCTAEYNKEASIRFDDPRLNIAWPLPKEDIIVSDKDKALPYL